jgi:hypothetical protein
MKCGDFSGSLSKTIASHGQTWRSLPGKPAFYLFDYYPLPIERRGGGMKTMLLLVTSLALAAFASGAMAIRKPVPDPAPDIAGSNKPQYTVTEKFSGTIEQVDERANTILVRGKMMKNERTLTFSMDSKTKITQGETTMTPGDLRKTMEVSIEYKKEMGKLIPIVIDVAVSKKGPKKMQQGIGAR